jgi:hypothetical protein
MNLIVSPDGVIVSARLGGLVEALRQFSQLDPLAGSPYQHLTPFSREVRLRHSIALWRQYSRLIDYPPTRNLGSGAHKTPQRFKGSVSSANVHKECKLVPVRTLVTAFLSEYLAPLSAFNCGQ